MKLEAEPEEKEVQNLKRRFVKIASISQYLYCTICFEVFNDPVQGPCQHTFCRKCLEQLFQTRQKNTKSPCPQCRFEFLKKMIRRNMIANQLINELEIFCSNRGCSWQGQLEQIRNHLENCSFKDDKQPEWLKLWLLANKESHEGQEAANELLDEDVQEKLNKEIDQPLTLRMHHKVSANQQKTLGQMAGFATQDNDKPRTQQEARRFNVNNDFKDLLKKLDYESDDDIQDISALILDKDLVGLSSPQFGKNEVGLKNSKIQNPEQEISKLMKLGYAEAKCIQAYEVFQSFEAALEYLQEGDEQDTKENLNKNNKKPTKKAKTKKNQGMIA